MRDYQRHKNNKYQLPNAVYHQTLWIIRDYERVVEKMEAIIVESPSPADGMPRGGSNGMGEVIRKVEKREAYLRKTTAIEKAMDRIPEEYRKGIYENITQHKAYPQDADRSTYARNKSKFIYHVAEYLELI